MNVRNSLALLLLTGTFGCAPFDEQLPVNNLQGTVVVPRAAATRVLVSTDGSSEEVTDPALIGPVYLGLYASVEPANQIEQYPHPEVGPQFIEDVPGDAYPYGGTTVGDLRFGCMEFFSCKLTSGRHVDFDGLVSWFNETLEIPISDASGAPVENGEYLRQVCYDLLNVTSDSELRITAFEDRNEDGTIDELDLDFIENADGDFEADFTIWQQEHFYDQNQEDCEPGVDCTGMALWGFMDSPSTLSYTMSTCKSDEGREEANYDNSFESGRAYRDVLNQPAKYITEGDWTSTEEYVWSNWMEKPRLVLDFEVQ